MNDLEGCARELRVALGDPAQLHATPGLFERFLEAYRTSDESDAQVLDASDAHVIEPGSPPERPAMWSTKKLRADQPHPWVASNGRWIVSQLTDGAWSLERRFGGRWQRATDGSWLCHSDPILTRPLPAFTTQWEALWLALRIDFWDRVHDGDFEHAPDGVVERIQRTGRPDIRYLDEDPLRYVTVEDDDGDIATHVLGGHSGDAEGAWRRLDPTTRLHRAIERAAPGELREVASRQPYWVTVRDVSATPPKA
jgi:hypothetical protein